MELRMTVKQSVSARNRTTGSIVLALYVAAPALISNVPAPRVSRWPGHCCRAGEWEIGVCGIGACGCVSAARECSRWGWTSCPGWGWAPYGGLHAWGPGAMQSQVSRWACDYYFQAPVLPDHFLSRREQLFRSLHCDTPRNGHFSSCSLLCT